MVLHKAFSLDLEVVKSAPVDKASASVGTKALVAKSSYLEAVTFEKFKPADVKALVVANYYK